MEKTRPIIGEVGPKHRPMFERSIRVRDAIMRGGLYVGIDTDTENLSEIALDNTAVARGDLSGMHTIPDAYFDEMWVVNVFGQPVQETNQQESMPGSSRRESPRIKLFERQFLRGEPGTALSCLFQNEDAILNELHRVMRPKSTVYIIELLTPNIAYRLREIDFTQYGFDALQYTTKPAVLDFFKEKHIDPTEYERAISIRQHRVEFAKTNDPFVIALTRRT